HLDFRQSVWTKLFFELLSGLLVFTIGFAIISTHGKTALVGMFLFWAASMYWTRKENPVFLPFTAGSFSSSIGWMLGLALLIFLPFAWFKIPYAGLLYPGYMGDYLYYAEIAEFAKATGHENIYAASNMLGNDYHGVSPYHFFDLWLNSLISECTNLPYVVVEETIDWAIFRLLVVIGFLAIVEKYTKITFATILCCFLLLFFTGYYSSLFDSLEFLRVNNKLMQSIANGKKIAASLIFFIGFYLLWIHRCTKAALCFLMAGSFASIGNVLGISAGIFAWGCVLWWKKEIRMAYYSMGIALLGILLVGIFYWGFGAKFPAIDYFAVAQHAWENPLSKLKFFASYLITIGVYNAPLVILGTYFLFKKPWMLSISSPTFQATMVLVGVLIGGALAAGIFTGEFQDGDQFLMNVYIPVIAIILLVCIIHLPNLLNLWSRSYALLLIVLSMYAAYGGVNTYKSEKTNSEFWASNYSSNYLSTISSALQSIQNPIGASINAISPDPFYHKKYYIYNPLGYYMKTMAKGFHTISLSTYEICTQCPGFQFLCLRDRFGFYTFAT
ncbi:MAG: hypothetical protein K2Q22_10540, partial [Cytophagales bacterium]|nr:hypothetical protein [Cytophagales bacterium]